MKPLFEVKPQRAGKFEDTDNMPDDPEQAGWDEHISQ
jgi:hypothetical protein